jgi:hypothetical protein
VSDIEAGGLSEEGGVPDTESGGLSEEGGVPDTEAGGLSEEGGASNIEAEGLSEEGGASDTGGIDPPAHANAIAPVSSAKTRTAVTEWKIPITSSTRLSAAARPQRERTPLQSARRLPASR